MMLFTSFIMMLLPMVSRDVMFAIKCGEATHHSRSVITGRSLTSFAEGKHYSSDLLYRRSPFGICFLCN